MDFTSLHAKIERLLKKRAFVGHYIERRLVSPGLGYRDVICLPNEEADLINDLIKCSKHLEEFHPQLFSSFTPPGELGTPTVYCLWTELSELPFGCYWFQIRSVLILDNQVIYKVKSIREVADKKFDPIPSLPIAENLADSKIHSPVIPEDFLSKVSIINIVRFVLILMATLVTGSFHVIKFTGDFTIKFMREASVFMHSSTPFMLGVLEFISKCVGGFYILLAMIWRSSQKPMATSIPQGNMPAIGYDFPKRRNDYSDDVSQRYVSGSRR